MAVIQDEQLEVLGKLADQAENYAAASKLPMPPSFHVEQLREGLYDMARQIKDLYVALSGENPWSASGIEDS